MLTLTHQMRGSALSQPPGLTEGHVGSSLDAADADDARDVGAEPGDSRGQGGNPLRRYLSVIRRSNRLTQQEEQDTFSQLTGSDGGLRAAARSRLVESHLWLVPLVVRRFYRTGNGFEDLVAEGNLGLYFALDRFDPARGLRFSTYAKWWVTHAVTSAMARNAYVVRVPRDVLQGHARQRRAAHAAQHGLRAELADLPQADTDSDNESPNDRPPQRASAGADTVLPISESYEEQSDTRTEDDGRMQPEVLLALKEGLHLLQAALRKLPAREREVINSRYGLDGGEPRTLQEVAEALGLSAEGVRKIQLSAIGRLKQKLSSGWL